MKLYTQEEYKIHLLSESVELDTDDMLLMEAVEEADDILKELNDIANIEDYNDDREYGNKRNPAQTVSKFKKWWYSLDPEKKHKKIHKVLETIKNILSNLTGAIALISLSVAIGVPIGKIKLICGIISLLNGLVCFMLSETYSKNEMNVMSAEKDNYDKYINKIDELIVNLTNKKKDTKDQKILSDLNKEIISLKKDRNKIINNTRYIYFSKTSEFDQVDVEDTLRLSVDGDDELAAVLYDIEEDKNGKLKFKKHAAMDDVEYSVNYLGSQKNIIRVRNEFRKKPYLFANKHDYEKAFGKNTYDAAMNKFKKDHPYDAPHQIKNKNILNYVKFNPGEFSEYVYDYFFGKGAHEKALKKYKYEPNLKESSALLNTAMILVEAGEIESAQILLNEVNLAVQAPNEKVLALASKLQETRRAEKDQAAKFGTNSPEYKKAEAAWVAASNNLSAIRGGYNSEQTGKTWDNGIKRYGSPEKRENTTEEDKAAIDFQDARSDARRAGKTFDAHAAQTANNGQPVNAVQNTPVNQQAHNAQQTAYNNMNWNYPQQASAQQQPTRPAQQKSVKAARPVAQQPVQPTAPTRPVVNNGAPAQVQQKPAPAQRRPTQPARPVANNGVPVQNGQPAQQPVVNNGVPVQNGQPVNKRAAVVNTFNQEVLNDRNKKKAAVAKPAVAQ